MQQELVSCSSLDRFPATSLDLLSCGTVSVCMCGACVHVRACMHVCVRMHTCSHLDMFDNNSRASLFLCLQALSWSP